MRHRRHFSTPSGYDARHQGARARSLAPRRYSIAGRASLGPRASRAAAAARRYLVAHASHDRWLDFLTRAGQSDDWVTAFVIVQLARGGVPARELQRAVAGLRARQRPTGGWGYNASVPDDADATAWCIRAIHAVAQSTDDPLFAALPLLAQHRRSGGFSTYADDAALRRYLGAGNTVSLRGWCEQPHHGVTAAIALACRATGRQSHDRAERATCVSLRQDALAALRAGQSADGTWASYWWRTPMYATVIAIEALVTLGEPSDVARVAAASEWIASAQRSDGSWDGGDGAGGAFATGLALQALAGDPDRTHARVRGAAWLCRHQRPDGAWDPCPILQIPPPHVSNARRVGTWRRGCLGTGVQIADQNRLFATAVCHAALAGDTLR